MVADRKTDKAQESQRMKTKEKILMVAALLFSENGFEGTSVRTICAKAGVNLALVNYHFGTKEQLYLEVHKMIHAKSGKQHLWLNESPKPVADMDEWELRLNEIIMDILRTFMRDDRLNRCSRRLVAIEMSHPSKCLPILLEEFYKPFHKYLMSYFMMVAPGDSELVLGILVTSLINQVTGFIRLVPPWDRLICPEGVSMDEWMRTSVRNLVRMCRFAIEHRLLFEQ